MGQRGRERLTMGKHPDLRTPKRKENLGKPKEKLRKATNKLGQTKKNYEKTGNKNLQKNLKRKEKPGQSRKT